MKLSANRRVISLALGRDPTISCLPGQNPSNIPVFEDDEEEWVPFFSRMENCPPALQSYSFKPKRVVSNFRGLASLTLVSVEQNNAQIRFSTTLSPRSTGRKHASRAFKELNSLIAPGRLSSSGALNSLWRHCILSMPAHRRILSPYSMCHEVSSDRRMLYHASWILLLRLDIDPAAVASHADFMETCRSHSDAAMKIAESFDKTFTGFMLSYVSMYSLFVCA